MPRTPTALFVAILRAVRELHPDLRLWRDPPYEYETDRVPIDVQRKGSRTSYPADIASTARPMAENRGSGVRQRVGTCSTKPGRIVVA